MASGDEVKGRNWRRVVLITLDGVGAGALPDADLYGDSGADTLWHVAEACGGLCLPNLQRLGLANIRPWPGMAPVDAPAAAFGRMRERSAGKDTTTGHWEIAGIIQQEPLPTFSHGFPPEIIRAFTRETGLNPLGNRASSGTDILRELGEEHLRTGRPIVYTSADSVFQIAAHEEVISVDRLYEICRIARRILDPWRLGRVIARPFVGRRADEFIRTPRRHDFSLSPTGPTVLDSLLAAGQEVVGIGKIHDIFAGRGLSRVIYSESNADGLEKTMRSLSRLDTGMIFTNLVDFDMLYGHRQDAAGFGRALVEFDSRIPELLASFGEQDLLLLTADHGCDPTTPGTDHTREFVPLIAWSPGLKGGVDLGERGSFADVAATIGEVLAVASPAGESFLELMLAGKIRSVVG